jgi:tryptophanyl-tRNA synthetase
VSERKSQEPTSNPKRPRVLSGHRPTGLLHLGHLVGALSNWVEMQDDHECFFAIVDWHALTTHYENTSGLQESILEVATDWLAAGLDPERSTLFVQSKVPEHAELHLLLSMIVPLPWLERVPSYKEQQEQLRGERDLTTYGFLGYPVLQAADIVLYDANVVPVGEDQLPHIELTREITRRFNHLYGRTLVEPKSRTTATPRLPGTDGRKMSKSYRNTLALADPPDQRRAKILQMMTDPARKRRSDPGNPDICPVYSFHKVFSKPDEIEMVNRECRVAGIGCVDCKKILADNLDQRLGPHAERRVELERRPEQVREVLAEGARRAREVAAGTMERVRRATNLL